MASKLKKPTKKLNTAEIITTVAKTEMKRHKPTANDEASKQVRVGTVAPTLTRKDGQRRLTVTDVVAEPEDTRFRDGAVVQRRDYMGRACLEVARLCTVDGEEVQVSTGVMKGLGPVRVRFIPIDNHISLKVQELPAQDFDAKYTRLVELTVPESARMYAAHAKEHGASAEVLDILRRYTTIEDTDVEAAAKKQQDLKDQFKERIAMAKLAKQQAKSKRAERSKSAKPARQPGEKRETAASMFQDLIMAGALTDDAIFAKVKAKFGLDDKKRGYVGWYRNHLKKLGKKPPEPKTK